MLSAGLLPHGQIFPDSHRHCTTGEVAKMDTFGVKRVSNEKLCPVLILYHVYSRTGYGPKAGAY